MTEKTLPELIKEQFHKNNFIIRTNEEILSRSNDEKWAAIYCSSNGVYREDTVESFQKSIIETDNYEWYMTRFPYVKKHIFIRDISKRFYQFGINDIGLDSLDKIAKMIKKETKGYKIVTIGSSSGGMAAIVLGKMLNAEFTIAFSPLLCPYKPDESLELVKQKLLTKEYFNVVDYANSNVPIFFLYPNGSDWDIYNSSLVSNFQNVYFLPIISNIHGVPVNKRLLKELLKKNKEELKQIFRYTTADKISEWELAKKHFGKWVYLGRILDYIKKYPLFFIKKDFYTQVIRKINYE